MMDDVLPLLPTDNAAVLVPGQRQLSVFTVLYNAAAVYCRMGQWEQARDVLLSAAQERGGGRGGNIEVALDGVMGKQLPEALLVPVGEVFRPRKQDVEQLQQRDFLGKAKKPGFYEPRLDGAQDSRYMRVRGPHMARGRGQLTVPGGAMVFLFGEEDRDGMATVIYDGQPAGSAEVEDLGSVVVKVHYTYTVALSVPLYAPYRDVKGLIAQKLGQPASQLRLRQKPHGSQVLIPLRGEAEPDQTMQEVAEAGRATLWCQREDPLVNYTILYQMVALYDYAAQGPEDLEFSEGDTVDILGEVNEEWLEGHCAGNIGIFPSCFAYREDANFTQGRVLEADETLYSNAQ
ncbi:hypothetical protein F2P81_013766 [Scophthalmus maximus]|uniref:SH3 domain-containing protein n=1 Tax=Scophthalmus maximus TaxID=52904 RepID=A0A6A4SP52_SCOMX|nr:hypothetical protein F2P81_013766 [Scophthalmus maximus]